MGDDAEGQKPPARMGHWQRATPDLVPFAAEGPPVAGRQRSQRIRCGERERRFVVYVPSDHDGTTPLPLVLDLHGSTSYPEEQLLFSNAAHAADRHRMLVVAPEACDRAWNVSHDPARADDVAFIADAIDLTCELLPLDFEHCYATGFSGGARMLARLVSGLPRELRAIAPVSGIRFAPDCPPERRPAVLAFHGTLDKVNPYAGGGLDYWQTGVEHEVEAWARHNGVADRRSTTRDRSVTHTVFGTGQSRVELYKVDDLGHIWAGFARPLGELFDPPSTAVDATAIMFSAFAALSHAPPHRTA